MNADNAGPGRTSASDQLSIADILRYRAGKLAVRFTSLFSEIGRFGGWAEHEAFPVAGKADEDLFRLDVCCDEGFLAVVGDDCSDVLDEKHSYPCLCRFFADIGVTSIELDKRLEQNQIEDVLTYLYVDRRKVKGVGAVSVHLACTETQIRDGVLSIRYSYCVTRFSRIVHWFEDHHREFRDHRALFQSAAWYGLLAAMVAIVPAVLYVIGVSRWVMLTVMTVETGILFSMIYLFFMIVGSVEYDNEEKAYRLGNAYAKLKRYADRIQADVERARVVQQRFLPDPADMPLADRVEWASSFVPQTEVGGDYFDVQAIDSDRAIILFVDVSGHGMGAAFITGILKTAFQTQTDNGGELDGLVHRLNTTLCQLIPDDSFAAVFLAVYDARLRRLQYVNCGHHPEPWLVRADPSQPVQALSDARSLILGVDSEIQVVQSHKMLQRGDKVVIVSDGYIEARNVNKTMYGKDRLQQNLDDHRAASARELVDHIVAEVGDFATGTEQEDDQTVLAFRIK